MHSRITNMQYLSYVLEARARSSRLFHRFRRGRTQSFYDYCGQRTISARRYLSGADFKGLNRDGEGR